MKFFHKLLLFLKSIHWRVPGHVVCCQCSVDVLLKFQPYFSCLQFFFWSLMAEVRFQSQGGVAEAKQCHKKMHDHGFPLMFYQSLICKFCFSSISSNFLFNPGWLKCDFIRNEASQKHIDVIVKMPKHGSLLALQLFVASFSLVETETGDKKRRRRRHLAESVSSSSHLGQSWDFEIFRHLNISGCLRDASQYHTASLGPFPVLPCIRCCSCENRWQTMYFVLLKAEKTEANMYFFNCLPWKLTSSKLSTICDRQTAGSHSIATRNSVLVELILEPTQQSTGTLCSEMKP